MQTRDNTPANSGEKVRHRVLVVDDEPGVRGLLQTALSRYGFEVSAAADADEAFAKLPDFDPQFAIVDINLPGVNGLELCEVLTAEHGIDVLLITGDDGCYSYEDAARSGASDFLPKPIRMQELVLRVERAVAARRVRLERDETVTQLRHLSMTDGLTGLFNARHFALQLQGELVRSARYGHGLSLILLDLDHFKRVNDRYGHQVGDRVLKGVAVAIHKTIREPDSAYRYGGEEFSVILPETNTDGAVRIAERLMQAIASESVDVGDGEESRVTASLGIAQWRKDEDASTFLKRADMAMYRSKQNGRNRFTLSNEVSGVRGTRVPVRPPDPMAAMTKKEVDG